MAKGPGADPEPYRQEVGQLRTGGTCRCRPWLLPHGLVASSPTPDGSPPAGSVADSPAHTESGTESEALENSTAGCARAGLDSASSAQAQGSEIPETISTPAVLPPLGGPPPSSDPAPRDPLNKSAPTAPLGSTPTLADRTAGGTEHPVRQRLLARAAAARQARLVQDRVSEPDELNSDSLDPVRALERQLDRVAPSSRRPPSAPLLTRVHTQLSPTMISVFGTLLGLATVASLVAVAIQLDPKDESDTSTGTAKVAPGASAGTPAPQPVKRVRKRIPSPWRISDAAQQAQTRIVKGQVGRIPFLKAIQDAGVTRSESYRILTAMKGLRNLDKCKSTDRFAVLIDRASSAVRAFEYIVSKEEVYQARQGPDGLLTAKRLDLKVERVQFKAAIAMHIGDLRAAAAMAGFEPGLITAMRKAVDGHMSVEEIQTGDIVRAIAQEVTVLGEFSRYAGIEALEYRPGGGNKPLRIYYFRGSDSRGYYNAKGRAPYEGGWRKPIPGAPVTSPFDLKRKHPVLKKTMPHYGVDFAAPAGTPVGASSYGTVRFVGAAGPSGKLVKIKHPGGIETGYAHLQRFAKNLQVGDRVKRLQLIGYCGSTGRSTGPHLHFSAKKDGKFIDPMSLNLDGMRVLPKPERPAFAQVKAKYDKLLESIPLPVVEPPPEPAVAAPEFAGTPSPSVVAMGADNESGASPPPEAAPASASLPQPAAPASPREAAVYLTDKELLEAQSATDDGEVAE